MTDLKDRGYMPSLAQTAEYVNNPLFDIFCNEIKETFKCSEKMEFSCCSLEPGWNIKFKKCGKNLCTVYPKRGFFTVLTVMGQKEKKEIEQNPELYSDRTKKLCSEKDDICGQTWIMTDIEDKDEVYTEVKNLIKLRRQTAGK